MADEYEYDLGIPPGAVFPTASADHSAQTWFQRGYIWAAGFHREEADFCFHKAVAADPGSALAWWGLALCNGPDYNFNEAPFYGMADREAGWPSLNVANDAARKAAELAATTDGLDPGHRAMMEALVLRYEWPVKADSAELKAPYAEALEQAAKAHPTNIEVLIAATEAIMCMSPWNLYDGKTTIGSSVTLNKYGNKVKGLLDAGLAVEPTSHWLCHLKVHLNEMGPVDHFDWRAANLLRRDGASVSGHSHLLHMPTHLDIQVGAYAEAMKWNAIGYSKDKELFAKSVSPRKTLWTGYIIHNIEFCAWAAMYGGHKATALECVAEFNRQMPPEVFSSSPIATMVFEAYTMLDTMVYVRFGLWVELLAIELKPDPATNVMHTLFLRYGRGIAHGALGDVAAARAEQAKFLELFATLKPGDRKKHNIDGVAMAEVARDILAGEILYREGRYADAFAVLRAAIGSQDAMAYDEPAGWLMSTRQTLAALLTEQEGYEEACKLYTEDLITYPNNPWSLAGLKLCYGARGDPRLTDVEMRYDRAMEGTDVKIGASCACALTHFESPAAKALCCEN